MTDRERLIELIKAAKTKESFDTIFADVDTLIDMPHGEEYLADYLLANGVIVPPCKVGDMVYDICTIFDESTLKPKTVIKPRIIDFVSKVGFIIESKGLVISEKKFGNTLFLTKEEAEQKLKEREG